MRSTLRECIKATSGSSGVRTADASSARESSSGLFQASTFFKDQPQSRQNGPQRRPRKPSHSFLKIDLVHRDHLSHIHDACFRQSRIAPPEDNVSRRPGPRHVRCDQADHGGCNAASIEKVALRDNARMPLGRSGSRRGSKVDPIHFPLADLFHQRSCTGIFVLSLRTNRRSSALGTSA